MPLDLPPDAGPAREAAIIAYAQQGALKFNWTPITVTRAGHTIVLNVPTDAPTIEGVRISTSAATAQKLADMLGYMMPTPRIMDLWFAARAVTLTPIVMSGTQHDIDVMATTARMLLYSQKIDAALAAQSDTGLVGPIWKAWVVSNALLNHPGKAENYGGFFIGSSFGGASWESSVDPPQRVIQGEGWAHDPAHVDYSQLLCLVRRDITVDGVAMDLAAALTNASIAPALNHDGVLKVLRQPGVAAQTPLACVAPANPNAITNTPPPPGECFPPTPQPPSTSNAPLIAAGVFVAAGAAILGVRYFMHGRHRLRSRRSVSGPR